MNVIITWLAALLFTLPGRILSSLGIGWLTYTGYKSALESLVSSVQSHINSVPVEIYNLLALSGFVTGIGVILAAIVARAGFVFVDKLARTLL